MKIGLYGGIANNIYVFAKALAAGGADVCFIRDRSDHYPFSQPAWEDLEFRLPYAEVPKVAGWPWARWEAVERREGWEAPSWLFDPPAAPVPVRNLPSGTGNPLDARWLRQYLAGPYRSSILLKMRECDALLACGIEGSILAFLSGKPFVIWPHGGDMMIAAGLLQPPWRRLRERIAHNSMRRYLVSAFAKAICIGNHEPTGISTDYYGAEDYIRRQKIAFLPIPIPVRSRPAATERRRALDGLLAAMGLQVPHDAIVGFVPSRLDYEWKGQDRLLQALVRLERQGRSGRLRLVFSGWGNDFRAAQRFAAEHGIAERLLFLDSALSKPLLFKYYLAADFVIDQFINGMYGTAALEAMACGAPLLTWLNDAYERPWGAPPVIQARSADDIAAALGRILDGSIDLEQTGRSLQEWLGRVHHPGSVVRDLLKKLDGD
jgi:glycosyltransferase involved in cell wall biosynthesis